MKHISQWPRWDSFPREDIEVKNLVTLGWLNYLSLCHEIDGLPVSSITRSSTPILFYSTISFHNWEYTYVLIQRIQFCTVRHLQFFSKNRGVQLSFLCVYDHKSSTLIQRIQFCTIFSKPVSAVPVCPKRFSYKLNKNNNNILERCRI